MSDTAAQTRAKITFEEFLGWDGEDQHVEWVDGEVAEMSPVSKEHMLLCGWLHGLLEFVVQAKGLGVVAQDPFIMKTGPDLPGRAPDIMFIAAAHLDRLKATYLDGPADLVIEVASMGTRGVDHGDKFYEYEQGGVAEYWLLDPERRRPEFFRLDAEGVYVAVPVGPDGIYQSSALPGFRLRVEWLWSRPSYSEIFPELGIRLG